MSCRIRAVEHRCAAGLRDAHSGLQDRIMLSTIHQTWECA